MIDLTLKSLVEVRDLLLPGLWAKNGSYPHLMLDMRVDWNTKSILVKGYNKKNKQSLGFAITEMQIVDGLYKGLFGPSVDSLIVNLNKNTSKIKYDSVDATASYQ